MQANNQPYIERSVDSALFESATAWLNSDDPSLWIALDSAPGRGNTSILEHLRARAQHDGLFEKARIVWVREAVEARDHEPRPLQPVASTFYAEYEALITSRSARTLSTFRRSWRTLALGTSLTMVLLVLIVFERYAEAVSKGWTTMAWWHAFLFQYLPSHLSAVWLAAALAVTIAFELLRTLFGHRGQEPAPRQSEALPNPSLFGDYHGAIFPFLVELCGRHKALVVLVDDASFLQEEEQQFLRDLIWPPSDPTHQEVQRFSGKHRVLVVTVGLDSMQWSVPRESDGRFQRLQVEPFADLELQQIIQHIPIHLDEREKATLVEQGRQSVKSILVYRDQLIKEEVANEFRRAQRERIRSFGLPDLMVYWAIRRVPSIGTREMVDWLDSLDADLLCALDLRPPLNSEALVNKFRLSRLVRSTADILYFDARSCDIFRQWLEENDLKTCGHAHFYWLVTFARFIGASLPPNARFTLTDAEKLAAKRAAWHAAALGRIFDKGSDFLTIASITPDDKARHVPQITGALIQAAEIWRETGNVREADDTIIDASEWLGVLERSAREPWLRLCARQLWVNYWSGGRPQTRVHLDKLTADSPNLREESFWIAHQCFEDFLKSSSGPSIPAQSDGNDSDLANMLRLGRVLSTGRQSHGFLVDALGDASFDAPEPAPAQRMPWVELALLDLRASFRAQQSKSPPDDPLLQTALANLRSRVFESSARPLAEKLYEGYYRARYWHLLVNCWSAFNKAVEKMDESESKEEQRRFDEWYKTQLATLVTTDKPVAELVLEQARAEYERALQTAGLLEWQPLLMEVSFHLGRLLLKHTPDSEKASLAAWWRTWEQLFESCLELERQRGWCFRTPVIHRLRWEFFETQDRPTSVSDAYNLFVAIKRSNYPTAIVLEWHQKVSSFLTNYGDSEDDERHCGELHQIWARELAGLPEAVGQRHFKHCLPCEQAYALLFAAQAMRQAKELDRADKLLTEAQGLFQHALSDASHPEDAGDVADFGVSLTMQRGWLSGAQGNASDETRMIRDAWRQVGPRGRHNANLLGSLLRVEERERTLDSAWPPDDNLPRHADPENSKCSLPSEWFQGPSPVRIANRYEFRFRQLLNLVTHRPTPGEAELLFGVLVGWGWLERFGESVLTFANYDLARGYGDTSRMLMVSLLKAVAHCFASVEPDDDNELAAHLLLTKYEPDVFEHRLAYIGVLQKHKELLKREFHIRGGVQGEWLAVGRRMDHYFSVLVDSAMLGLVNK